MSVSGASRDPSNVGEKPRSNPRLFTFLLLIFIGVYYKPAAGVLFRKIRRIVFALSVGVASRHKPQSRLFCHGIVWLALTKDPVVEPVVHYGAGIRIVPVFYAPQAVETAEHV